MALCASAMGAEPVPVANGEPWTAAQVASLASEVARRLAAPALRGAHLGFYAIDTRRGTVLYARAPDEAFVPASTLKLVTGSAALERLGGDFRFHTAVLASVDGDTIRGDVTLRAGGDPLLRTSDGRRDRGARRQDDCRRDRVRRFGI
jgi:serine-type D-Ala-D-Ala carboxypeptidase/endopeptidase (penicillin-binding protein 4)